MLKKISEIPSMKRPLGTTAVEALIKSKGISRPRVKRQKGLSSKEKTWQTELADELHKPIKHNFTRRRVIAYYTDQIWCSDLVEMQQFSKWNKSYRYILMVLDVFSKY